MTKVIPRDIIFDMETYYTVDNFLLYSLSLIIILLFVPLIVYYSDNSRPLCFRLTLWCPVLAAVAFPLSRTCPYPVAEEALRWGGLLAGCSCPVLVLFTLAGKIRRTYGNPLAPTSRDYDRWTAEILRGSSLVIDPDGRILGGHLGSIGDLPLPGESFSDYFALLDGQGNDWKGEGDGYIRRDGRVFRWTSTLLGENVPEGYLFCLRDLTEEHRLLDERSAQEKLQTLRSERITRQGIVRAQEEKARFRGESVRRSIEAVKSSLNRLIDYLGGLTTEGGGRSGPGREDLEWAVILGSETMQNIRETVHNMTEGER